jgi:GMP synthase-like glutamine amidotransferase
MHEFHKRVVEKPPLGFAPLAEACQVLLSDHKNFLTFQGHPEMTDELMELLLLSPMSREAGYIGEDIRKSLLDRATAQHDGLKIFRTVVK